jgi:hypothetical protein
MGFVMAVPERMGCEAKITSTSSIFTLVEDVSFLMWLFMAKTASSPKRIEMDRAMACFIGKFPES